VPINAPIDVLFNMPLDSATVSTSTVTLSRSGTPVPVTVSLSASGSLMRVQPQALLLPTASYSLQINGARGANGVALSLQIVSFVTGPSTTADTQPPHVAIVGPANGVTDIALNAQTHWHFDEPMSEVSLAGVMQGDATQFWSADDRDVHFIHQRPLPANAQVTETLGPTPADYAGNALEGPASTTFTTGNTIDQEAPTILEVTPLANAPVPLNSVIRVRFTEPLDPASVQPGNGVTNFRDTTSLNPLPVDISLEPDGRTVRFIPQQPLVAGRVYVFQAPAVSDLANNIAAFNSAQSFTAGSVTDTQPPTVASTNVPDGQSNVPTNVVLQVTFSETLAPLAADSFQLKQGATVIPTKQTLSADRSSVSITLVRPLAPNAQHTLTISGIQDVSGNTQAAPMIINFTTGAGAQ
jgi:hypothetical protein